MFLYLLRHGDAQNDASVPDKDRALTPEGLASIQKVVRTIKRLNLAFDAVYSSPLFRARQTAELTVSLIESRPKPEPTEFLMPGVDFAGLFELLNRHSAQASVLLVGHEPFLGQLVSTLLTGNRDAKVEFGKASLCCLEVSVPVRASSAVLKWLIPPNVMD